MATATTTTTHNNKKDHHNGHHPLDDVDTQICPDHHRCENGSLCVEKAHKEGQYFCDCDQTSNGVYAGLYCQHEATIYCSISGALSKTNFCTNFGTCKGLADSQDVWLGCDCQSGYTGTHCQFIKGSEPDESFVSNNNNVATLQSDADNMKPRGGDGTGLGVVGLVVIIVVALAILSAMLAVVFRRWRQHSNLHTVETTKASDGHLPNADGSDSMMAVMPTQTFETEDNNNNINSPTSSSNGDDSNIDNNIRPTSPSVESGHLA